MNKQKEPTNPPHPSVEAIVNQKIAEFQTLYPIVSRPTHEQWNSYTEAENWLRETLETALSHHLTSFVREVMKQQRPYTFGWKQQSEGFKSMQSPDYQKMLIDPSDIATLSRTWGVGEKEV